MYSVYLKNHHTNNVIFIQSFEVEHDAYVFVITKNSDPMFEYYVRAK